MLHFVGVASLPRVQTRNQLNVVASQPNEIIEHVNG